MESRKYKVIEKLLMVEEEDIIYRLEKILDENQSDNGWDELPDEVKRMIDIGLAQSASGQVIPHEQIMDKYKRWYNIS